MVVAAGESNAARALLGKTVGIAGGGMYAHTERSMLPPAWSCQRVQRRRQVRILHLPRWSDTFRVLTTCSTRRELSRIVTTRLISLGILLLGGGYFAHLFIAKRDVLETEPGAADVFKH